jgi:hypothetical protein
MTRNKPGARSFRPELETLEGREVPAVGITAPPVGIISPTSTAAIGILPTDPGAAITRFQAEVNGLVTQIKNDFHTLQVDAAASSGFNLKLAMDYNKVGSDFLMIKGIDNQLHTNVAIGMVFLADLAASNAFTNVDFMLLAQITANVTTALSAADGALSTATTIINTAPGNGFPTVAAQDHL